MAACKPRPNKQTAPVHHSRGGSFCVRHAEIDKTCDGDHSAAKCRARNSSHGAEGPLRFGNRKEAHDESAGDKRDPRADE